MGMPPERICELEMDKPKLIEGTEVTPIDANHCPGACMFLLKTKGGPSRRGQVTLLQSFRQYSTSPVIIKRPKRSSCQKQEYKKQNDKKSMHSQKLK